MDDTPFAALSALLAAENRALAGMDLATAVALFPAKQAAAARLLATAAPAPSPALRAAAARLRDAAAENHRLLERALAVQGRVLAILADAVRAAGPPPNYARTGAYAAAPRAAYALSARA